MGFNCGTGNPIWHWTNIIWSNFQTRLFKTVHAWVDVIRSKSWDQTRQTTRTTCRFTCAYVAYWYVYLYICLCALVLGTWFSPFLVSLCTTVYYSIMVQQTYILKKFRTKTLQNIICMLKTRSCSCYNFIKSKLNLNALHSTLFYGIAMINDLVCLTQNITILSHHRRTMLNYWLCIASDSDSDAVFLTWELWLIANPIHTNQLALHILLFLNILPRHSSISCFGFKFYFDLTLLYL